MSLDVYLIGKELTSKTGTGVYIREKGRTRELSEGEVKEKWPDAKLSDHEYETNELFHANITHNLTRMAREAGIDTHLWTPEDAGIKYAEQLIEPLQAGFAMLVSDHQRFAQYNPPNGWGSYDELLLFVSDYLDACRQFPEAEVSVCR